MKQHIKKLKDWLDDNDDKPGKTGKPRKSNLTDNGSAKIKTSKGVIQGYDGVASVDSKHQIVIHAEAFGEAQEHDLLQPMIEGTRAHFSALDKPYVKKTTKLTADSGFYNRNNLEYVYTHKIDAYLPDIGFRKRDPRFQAIDGYKERHRKEQQKKRKTTHYTSQDFHYDAATHTCICYSRRIGVVEPVFANICSTLGLNRFSLRSKRKVDIQWKLYCLVHNLLKIHRYGEVPG
jgi:hypothetical protein